MKKNILTVILFISTFILKAQDYSFRKNINKDSLLNVSVKRLPEEMRENYLKNYEERNEEEKDFLLFMISMSKSSKIELIKNYENKKDQIVKLKSEYEKIVPKNHIVDIEIEPESKILNIPEQISIKIYKIKDNKKLAAPNSLQRNEGLKTVSQNWNLKSDSKELQEVLNTLKWTNETVNQIRQLLSDANCISIKNGKPTTIGFARSGMGKYSYKIFEEPLTKKQKEEYNDGCQYIYYKENIVLEYGGGAIGPQCFEKE